MNTPDWYVSRIEEIKKLRRVIAREETQRQALRRLLHILGHSWKFATRLMLDEHERKT